MDRRRIVALLGAGVLAAACGVTPTSPTPPAATPAPAPVASASPSPTAAPIPTPNPSPTPRALRPGEDDWGRVPFANGLRDRYGSTAINAMAEAGGTLVAVGRGPTGAAAWISTDLLTWRRVTGDPSIGGDQMSDVVAGGPGFVAVGSSAEGAIASVSSDGFHWQAIALPRGAHAWVGHVVLQGSTFVAFGGEEAAEEEQVRLRVWTSADGVSWEPLAAPAALDFPQSWGDTVGVGPPGIVYVAEREVERGEDGLSVVPLGFRLEGTTTWRPSTFSGPDGYVTGITWHEDRFVAVGGDVGYSSPVAWTSPDGLTWQSVDVVIAADVDSPPPGAFASIVATADGRLLASTGYENDSRLWISDDGAAWSAVPWFGAEGTRWLNGMASFGDRLVAFGGAEDAALVSDGYDAGEELGAAFLSWGTMTSAAIWTDPSPGLAEPAPAPPRCPEAKPTLLEVISLSPADRMRCFGRRSITFLAYLDRYQFGYEGPVPRGPPWLISADDGTGTGNELWARPLAVDHPRPVVSLSIHVDPASKVGRRLPDAGWVWLTGRFDHPKAKSCQAAVRAQCRQAFVVTNVRKAAAP